MSDLAQLLSDLSSGDDRLAEKSVEQLLDLKEDAIPDLLKLRDSTNEDARWWAYCTLGQMHDVDVNWFFPGLDDPCAGVRESAAMALCHHPKPIAIPRLIAVLDDPDRLVATLAANALIGIGKDATLDLMIAFEKGTPAAQIEVVRALSEIHDQRAIPLFMSSQENGSEMVKFWAEQGLENLGVGMVYFNPN
jgi:hypothetical protein